MKFTKQAPLIFLIILINIIFCLGSFSFPKAAEARGGCFGGQTEILTPQGNQAIEELQVGDLLLTRNLKTSEIEIGKIGDIQVTSSSDYYIINHHLTVTGTHPFYVKTEKKWKLVKVQDLKVGDRLIDSNNAPIEITDIEHIRELLTVYNLMAVNPNKNFYAEGFLVHNKDGEG